MKERASYHFAALRFTEDENISDRVYWYLSDFPVRAGEQVLAPVGAHNRLQCAVVERTIAATREEAPYDLRLVKSVAARFGDRERVFGGTLFWELGGVRYDFKRFTRFEKILFTDREELSAETKKALAAFGVKRILHTDGDIFSELCGINCCTVLYGKNTGHAVREILAAVRGQECSLPQEIILALREKLR